MAPWLRNVHVADQVAQAEQGFHQQVAFLAIGLDLDRLFTGAQAAAAGQALSSFLRHATVVRPDFHSRTASGLC